MIPVAFSIAFIAIIVAIGAFGYHVYLSYLHNRWMKEVFDIDQNDVIEADRSRFQRILQLKLTRSGITQKELIEVAVAGVIAGTALAALPSILDFSIMTSMLIWIASLAIALGTAPLYLEEQIQARIKRIEEDLSIFIDLMIIILEGGGGLNNAIDQVTREGSSVIRHDLLEESRLFKNEYITYNSDIAYANLVHRTGSEAIATLVSFIRLSEETGIGVKSVFENQSREIKEKEMLNVEKHAAMMNIHLTLMMFLFILPSLIAMIAFPISAEPLMSGF